MWPEKKQGVSGVIRSARLCVACHHSSSGTCRTQILTTLQTSRQQITCSPTCRKRLQDCQRNLLPRCPILHSTSESTAPLRIFLESHFAVAAPNSRASSACSSKFPPISNHVSFGACGVGVEFFRRDYRRRAYRDTFSHIAVFFRSSKRTINFCSHGQLFDRLLLGICVDIVFLFGQPYLPVWKIGEAP